MRRWSLTTYPLISALSLGLWAVQPTTVPETHWGHAAAQWLDAAPAAGSTGSATSTWQARPTPPFAAGPSIASPVTHRFSAGLTAPASQQERR